MQQKQRGATGCQPTLVQPMCVILYALLRNTCHKRRVHASSHVHDPSGSGVQGMLLGISRAAQRRHRSGGGGGS